MSEFSSDEIARVAQRLSEGWDESDRTTTIALLASFAKLRKFEEESGLISTYKRAINTLSLMIADMTAVEKRDLEKLKVLIRECEGDGGCRAFKALKEITDG